MSNSTAKRFWIIGAALVAVGLIGIYFARPYKFIDFSVYYDAGRSLLDGRTDLYAPDFALSPALDYRYPPLFVVLISPFSLLPAATASYIWYWLNVLEIGAAIYLVRKMLGVLQPENSTGTEQKNNRTAWALTFLIVTQYFLMSMTYGNIHTFVTLLLFAAFYLLMRRRDGWAAILMSLAITIKIIPLVALPYFAVKKRWTFLTLTILLTILLNLAPSLYFGFNRNAELLQTWYRHVVLNHESHEQNSWTDLSLKGELRRYLTEVDYSKRTEGTGNSDSEYEQVNFISVTEETSNRIWIACSLIIFALSLLAIRLADSRAGNDSERQNKNTLIEYSLIVCLILFVGPLTPKIYFIKLLLPAAFLSSLVFGEPTGKNKLNRFILILAAAANSLLPLLPGSRIQRTLLVIGIDFFILCLLMIVAFNLLLAQIESNKPPRKLTETPN